jgi:hypothetical protein
VRINFTAVCNTSESDLRSNEAAARSLGLPEVGRTVVSERLAVVGGGASVVECIDELRAFPGEVWAINGAFHWCLENGIDATFYSIDARRAIASMAEGAARAVLSVRCHPETFAAIDGPIEVYAGQHIGPSSAVTASLCAIQRGHRHVSFYGCDSCYTETVSAPKASPLGYTDRILVRADGSDFLTDPGLFMQAELLAEIVRSAPAVFDECSGGLLRALVADPEWDIIAASQSIHDKVKLA